jgi:sorting nexin-1/2
MASSDDDPTKNLLDEDLDNGHDDREHHRSAFLQESGDGSPELTGLYSDDSPPPFSLEERPQKKVSKEPVAWTMDQRRNHATEQPPTRTEVAGKGENGNNPGSARKRGMEEEEEQSLSAARRGQKKDSKKNGHTQSEEIFVSQARMNMPMQQRPALETHVLDPKVVGTGTDKHVEYQVDTHVESNLAQISFDGHTKFSVFRRFSDFYWLRDTLEQRYPGFIIPPLPDKTVPILQNNLAEKFFLSRARSLDYFLSHVATHTVLSRDVALKDFLIAEHTRFEQVRKPSISADPSPVTVQVVSSATAGLFERVLDWGQNLGNTLNNTISGAARIGAQRRERDTADDRFDEAQRYINELEPKIKFVYDTAKQLVEKNQQLSKALHELGLAFTNMGQSEQQGPLSDAVTELGNVCNGREGLSVLVNLQAEQEQVKFLEPIEDYVRLVSAAKQALSVRIKTALAYEYALGDLIIKKSTREKMTPDDSRIMLADSDITEAQRRAESAKTDFEMVTDRVLKEIERFKREKSQDFKALILHYVQLQIDHNQAVEMLWKGVLPKLHRVKAPNDEHLSYGGDDV